MRGQGKLSNGSGSLNAWRIDRINCRVASNSASPLPGRSSIALLLADEPTGALDSQTTAEVLDLFDDLHRQGITLVMVTHEDDVAARARQVARFQDGRLLSSTPALNGSQ